MLLFYIFSVPKPVPGKNAVSELTEHKPIAAAELFANDGSFLEKFKKLQEDYKSWLINFFFFT